MSNTVGRFFQIEIAAWNDVLTLGLNAAVVYLVLACGTGRDNRRTRWSANAVERYTGISRSRAHAAIQALEQRGLLHIQRAKTSAKSPPIYTLAAKGRSLAAGHERNSEWIWLPNTIVTGASEETPPVEQIRQAQSFQALELFVRLYAVQCLAEDGGLRWDLICGPCEQTRITERGPWVLFGINRASTFNYNLQSSLIAAFAGSDVSKETSDALAEEFIAAWRVLTNLGLIEDVMYMIEAKSGGAELMFPCDPTAGTEVEQRIADLANEAAQKLLGKSAIWQSEPYEIVVPIPRHFERAWTVRLYRLRYRANTKMTAAWMAKQRRMEHWSDAFREMAMNGGAPVAPPTRRVA